MEAPSGKLGRAGAQLTGSFMASMLKTNPSKQRQEKLPVVLLLSGFP